ncbi:uncharacterized protein [Coffea arabica]|uniref:B box-type domain-containing protein n=1 Tax=Coffea arabica TaxID=13443 RepID=A0A6P6S779_COFAR
MSFAGKVMEKACCELCGKAAKMYCVSDEARLCWDCDEKVHSANFLVAKHSRNLLCHVCQSPTPWKASGTKLGPTISVCQRCLHSSTPAENPAVRRTRQEQVEEAEDETTDQRRLGDDQYSDGSEDSDGYDDYDDDEFQEEEDEEEDGENQVVPWSSSPAPSSSALPLTTSSSSEHGSFSSRDGGAAVSSALKRSRDNRPPDSDDEDVCCSTQINLSAGAMEDRSSSLRSLKTARAEEELVHGPESEIELMRKKGRMELLGSFLNFQQTTAAGENDASEVIRNISKLSRDAH